MFFVTMPTYHADGYGYLRTVEGDAMFRRMRNHDSATNSYHDQFATMAPDIAASKFARGNQLQSSPTFPGLLFAD
jgi:hypothetical protein